MCELTPISERRACRLAGLSRDPFRHEPISTPATQALSLRLVELAFDALANGRRIKCLTVVDDLTRESVDIAMDHRVSGAYVVRLLDQAACFRGYPRAVRTDNGQHWFMSLTQARDVIGSWRRDYHEVRPHSSCGRIPSSQFAANHRAQSDNNAVIFNPGLVQ